MKWIKAKSGNVELVHHSTASVIELIITKDEPTEGGGTEKSVESISMDYKTWSDIKSAILHTLQIENS